MKRLLILLLTFALLLPALAEDNYPENIPCEYEGQTYFLSYDAQRGVFRLKDAEGATVRQKLFGSLTYSEATDTYLIKIGEQYGYLDGEGNWLFPFGFDEAYAFQDNGVAVVRTGDLWGYVRSDGTYLFEPQFTNDRGWGERMQFHHGAARVRKDGLYGFIREDGTYLFEPQFTDAKPFWYCTITLVGDENGLYGYVTTSGEFLFEPQFEWTSEPFMNTDDIARVWKNGLAGFIKADGTFLLEPQFEEASGFGSAGYAHVRKDGYYGLVGLDGAYLIEPRFEKDIYFYGGLAAEPVDGLYGYIDMSGAFVIPPAFAYACAFSEEIAAVRNAEGKWGYINTAGEYVTEPKYDSAYAFEHGFGIVEMLNGRKTEWWGTEFDDYYVGLVDHDGREVLEPIYDYIEVTEDGIITAEKDGEERICTYENGKLKDIEIVDTVLDLSDYYPNRGEKVVTLGEEADIAWDSAFSLPRLDGATALLPTYSAFAQATYPQDTHFEYYDGAQFTCTKTNRAYDNLIYGETDIIFCAGPSDAQIEDALDAGVEFEFTLMGYESFVFIVNRDNPLESITLEQIKDIYSGKLTQWDEVGVSGMGDIIAYQRPKNSGSQTALEKLMGDTPLMEAPQMYVSDGMEDILTTIEYRNFPNAIGYTFRFFCADMVGSKVKLLAVDGVEANVENIRNGSYPIITPLYAVTRKGDTNPNIQIFLDWIKGPQGQELLEKSGYVGIAG
ncbi:MAG: WG repeat-containing protein [Clostridia bacterium]|nr:WG repeat-containing protein [Clostridia bacterium]